VPPTTGWWGWMFCMTYEPSHTIITVQTTLNHYLPVW
jgi:hypothetical protein